MNCFCDSGITNELKIEGDIGVDPIWCARCGCNLDMEDVPISNELKAKLSGWMMGYGRWIDWKKDQLLPNGIEREEIFNQMGATLTEKVRQELGELYIVKYSSSTSARFYAKK